MVFTKRVAVIIILMDALNGGEILIARMDALMDNALAILVFLRLVLNLVRHAEDGIMDAVNQ